MKYPHLAARLFNTPLLVHPQKLDAIIAGLGARLLGGDIAFDSTDTDSAALLPVDMFSTRRGKRADAGYMVTDGVAVISANGALVHRTRLDADSNFLLGYNDLARKAEDAMDDPDVHAVLQIYDSPGGEVSGAFEYSDRIHALRGKKPMYAIADSLAASAAYLGGSAFDQLSVSQTGYAGSIGVVMRHVDLSVALQNEGVRVTHIYAGDHKIDGNPYEALPKSVRADFQDEINSLYELFVAAVARNTGLSVEAIRATQAAVYRGQAAVDIGLATAWPPPINCFQSWPRFARGRSPSGRPPAQPPTTKESICLALPPRAVKQPPNPPLHQLQHSRRPISTRPAKLAPRKSASASRPFWLWAPTSPATKRCSTPWPSTARPRRLRRPWPC